MGDTTAALRSGKTFAEIVDASELSDEALALRADHQQPEDYVAALVEHKHYADAVRVLAHALPKREAVWWAWVSAKRTAGENPPDVILEALQATEAWIKDPTDRNRRVAMERAEAAEFSTAAGCAGLAAFFSGDSMAPPEMDPVPPGEYMAANAIAGSIVLAAVSEQPEKANERYASFVEQGLVIAEKIQLWTPPEDAP